METEATNARARNATRLALLLACLPLAACWNPVCDALVWECPAVDPGPDGGPTPDAGPTPDGGSVAQDGGVAPDSGNGLDAATPPDTGAKCVPGTWEFETVDTLSRDGVPRAAADFVVDADGEVHLTYSDLSTRYYVHRTRSGWSAPKLLGGGFVAPPSGSVALTSSGQVQAVWGDAVYQAGLLTVGDLLPGGWVRTNPAPCPEYGCGEPRLATDASGTSHLAFVVGWNDGNQTIRPRIEYAFRAPGGAWSQPEFVENVSAFEVAIAIGSDGPHLAYADATNLALKHATRVDGTWRIETVRKDMPNYLVPTLTVDEADGVHLGYLLNEELDFRHAYAHRPAGGEWVFEEVGAQPGTLRASASVATRSGESLLALQTAFSISVVRRSGGGWRTDRVTTLSDDTLSDDRGPLLRVDPRGGLHLVYPDWGSAALVYARQCPVP